VPDPVRYHFDVISPFAYLAWNRIHAVAIEHGREVLGGERISDAELARWTGMRASAARRGV